MTDKDRRYTIMRGHEFVLRGDDLIYDADQNQTKFALQTEAIALVPESPSDAIALLTALYKLTGSAGVDEHEIARLVRDLRAEWEWADD